MRKLPPSVAMTSPFRSYADVLRAKGLAPLDPPHTAKQPGDWIQTGTGFVRAAA